MIVSLGLLFTNVFEVCDAHDHPCLSPHEDVCWQEPGQLLRNSICLLTAPLRCSGANRRAALELGKVVWRRSRKVFLRPCSCRCACDGAAAMCCALLLQRD